MFLLAGAVGAAAGGTLSDYRLLVLGGGAVKWGSTSFGEGASVTYAVVHSDFTFEGARNCVDITPPDRLLATNDVSRAEFDGELDQAFRAWSTVADVRFHRVDQSEADILIGAQAVPRGRAFTNVVHEPSPDGVRAGRIVGSVICLNPEEGWKVGFDGNLDVYDLRYTMMHEIGHAIGLDHPGVVNAVMDFRYSEAFASLRDGDSAGAVNLYGPSQVGAANVAIPPAEVPTETAGQRAIDERAFGK